MTDLCKFCVNSLESIFCVSRPGSQDFMLKKLESVFYVSCPGSQDNWWKDLVPLSGAPAPFWHSLTKLWVHIYHETRTKLHCCSLGWGRSGPVLDLSSYLLGCSRENLVALRCANPSQKQPHYDGEILSWRESTFNFVQFSFALVTSSAELIL